MPSPPSKVLFRSAGAIAAVLNRLHLSKPALRLFAALARRALSKRDYFAHYTPDPGDVFVCTYTKSGTNWLLQIVTQIAHFGDASFSHIHHIAPWVEVVHPGDAPLQRDGTPPSPTGIRAVKTHLNADRVAYHPQPKYLVLLRDPKEVLISSYHFFHASKPFELDISFDDWTQLFIEGNSPFFSWPEHTAGFWAWRERDNVLLLTYKSLSDDLAAGIRKIADFLQVELNDAQMASVMNRSRFAYMQAHDELFAPKLPSVAQGTGPVMLRSGKAGNSKEMLSPDQRTRLDAIFAQQLRDLGSDLPYDAIFGPNAAPTS